MAGAQNLDDGSSLTEVLQRIYAEVGEIDEGALADYIPELTKADPGHFGIALARTDRSIVTVGAADEEFTIQSVSKPFTYCLALDCYGRHKVLERIGVEPSGEAFNSIVFDPKTSRPFNPMVNAGAITITALLYEAHGADTFDFILDRFSDAAGRPLKMSEEVYRSEARTGDRNRAITYLLRNVGVVGDGAEEALDVYFRQCSILVSARDLAHMGATLANVGESTASGNQVFGVPAVRDTLSVMLSAGMYDYSGNWIYDVGFPAKSGVGGGIMGVVNRQMGIATFSPLLDRLGNSVRGTLALRQLSDELGLHVFEWSNYGSQYLRRSTLAVAGACS